MNRDLILKFLLVVAIFAIGVLIFVVIAEEEKEQKPSDFGRGKRPTGNMGSAGDLQVLGKYDTRFGHLYVYKLGTDTIYVGEGYNASTPISIEIK